MKLGLFKLGSRLLVTTAAVTPAATAAAVTPAATALAATVAATAIGLPALAVALFEGPNCLRWNSCTTITWGEASDPPYKETCVRMTYIQKPFAFPSACCLSVVVLQPFSSFLLSHGEMIYPSPASNDVIGLNDQPASAISCHSLPPNSSQEKQSQVKAASDRRHSR